MKLRTLAIAAVLVTFAGSAKATMIAGWDFSQWNGPGQPSVDNLTFQDTLTSNYSDFDPTFNAGAESAVFGELFFDGTNGSTDVAEGTPGQVFAPYAVPGTGSLSSNIDAPVVNPFDSHTILDNEGQTNTNLLGMSASDIVSVVFEADISSVPLFKATNWEISLAGLVIGGDGSATITVDFSTDGTNYTSFGSLELDGSDRAYRKTVSGMGNDTGYFRLNIQAGAGEEVVIDNVAIAANVPVFSSGLMQVVFAGLMGFVALRPRRTV